MSETSPRPPSPPSTCSAGASPARTSPPQETERGWRVRDPACSSSLPASLASYDPESSSWRTSQRSLLGDWVMFSGPWPLSGTMLDGAVCELQRWAHPTGESDGSASAGWPTPTKSSGGDRKHCGISGTTLSGAAERVKAWPTPTAHPFDQPPEVFDRRREILRARGINGNGAGLILAVEVRRAWPTPAASDHKGSSKPGQRRGQLSEATEPHQPGRLSPDWVEALMGFPAGWTLTDGQPLRGHSTPGSHLEPDPAGQTTEGGCTPLETPSCRSAAR